MNNKGNKGAIDRLGNYHPQEFYYPLWIEEDSYTLYGTCLKARTEQSPSTGMWSNNPFGWGYADNIGDDMPNKDNPNAGALGNYFKISDALNNRRHVCKPFPYRLYQGADRSQCKSRMVRGKFHGSFQVL